MLPIDPKIIAQLPAETILHLQSIPEEVNSLGTCNAEYLDDLQKAYDAVAADQQLSKELLSKIILHTYQVVKENLSHKGHIDVLRSEILNMMLRPAIPSFRG